MSLSVASSIRGVSADEGACPPHARPRRRALRQEPARRGACARPCRRPGAIVATAQALDAEMAERIALHVSGATAVGRRMRCRSQLARPCVARLGGQAAPILVDCLTLWLTNLMLGEHDVATAVRRARSGARRGARAHRARRQRGRARHRAGECAGAPLPRRGGAAQSAPRGARRSRDFHGGRAADAR